MQINLHAEIACRTKLVENKQMLFFYIIWQDISIIEYRIIYIGITTVGIDLENEVVFCFRKINVIFIVFYSIISSKGLHY